MGLTADVQEALSRTVWGYGREGLNEPALREAGLDPADPTLRRTLELAQELIGFPRHLSPACRRLRHRARARLRELVPIENAAMADRTVVEWDKDDLDALQMLKIDVLALGMLTCIRKGFELLRAHYGIAFELATVPAEDAGRLRDAVPRRFDRRVPGREPGADVDAAAAQAAHLLRPGDRGRDRPPGPDPGRHGPPLPAPPRGQGAGRVPLRRAARGAGQDPGRAAVPGAGDEDRHRRRRLHARPRPTGCAARWRPSAARARSSATTPSWSRAWSRAATTATSPSAASGRSRASAITASPRATPPASRSWSTSRPGSSATTRTCSAPRILNAQPMGFYAPAQLVRDAVDHGVEVREVDVNHSHWDTTLEPRQRRGPLMTAVRLGLRQIKGLGEQEAQRLVAARLKPYRTLEELRRRAGAAPRHPGHAWPRPTPSARSASTAARRSGRSRRSRTRACPCSTTPWTRPARLQPAADRGRRRALARAARDGPGRACASRTTPPCACP